MRNKLEIFSFKLVFMADVGEVLQVAILGNPVLRKIAEPVAEPTSDEITTLAHSLVKTMIHNHGSGIAAPQVSISKRVIIYRITPERAATENTDPYPISCLVNPELEFLTEEKRVGWEGCLSVPGIKGKVERCNKIRYRGYNPLTREHVDSIAEGFLARVLQHEVDHLDGLMFIDRSDSKDLTFATQLHFHTNWIDRPHEAK